VVVDDLAFMDVDAVVRPATALLEPATPALRRLEQVGGPEFYTQLALEHPLDVGAAVVTSAGGLGSEFVIHAVVRSAEKPVTRDGVRHALVSVLQRAYDWQLQRVATPVVGTGAGNLSFEDAAGILTDVLTAEGRHVEFPSEVYIVVDSEEERTLVEAYLKSRLARES
jgi:O-acetyl-ADP-ribose deacetylase (regulator of RNase III)